MNHITPTELQRNRDSEVDKLNHLKEIKSCNIIDNETESKSNNETDEGKEIITKNRTHLAASRRRNDESYGHISDVGTESIQFNGENFNLDLKTAWEEEDNINNIYSDCLEEDDSILFIHCSDHDIKKKTGKGNEKDLPPTLDNSERVITTIQETHIVDEKEEDINLDYLH